MHIVGRSVHPFPPPLKVLLIKSSLLFVLLLLAVAPVHAADQDQISSMRASVAALHSARQSALLEVETLPLSDKEATDYRDFIVYLNTRIANYCAELARLGGEDALKGLVCPVEPMSAAAGQASASENVFYTTGSATSETVTRAEKSAELDGDFLTSLGEFDEMLLKEEGKIAARVPSQRASSSSGLESSSANDGQAEGDTETGSAGTGDSAEQGEGTAESSATDGQGPRAETAAGDEQRAGSAGAEVDHSVYGAPGGKLPPPEDDDIVARQLREAAEKEPDPELKKKLWEEYWKYKGVDKQAE